ncbi:MAG: flavin reductase [Betaproteobacteria bacterium]|nr:flavin reductase [Betaproteobacteria bacterium]
MSNSGCHEVGDHAIIIARVERTHVHQAESLVHHAGKFTALAACEAA